jgi:hypothetical protein
MAKRTRIIEGTWDCTSCDTKGILARHKRCPTCNNPRELTGQESEFDFGDVDAKSGRSLREGVTDEKALDVAGAGEDWFCAYCGAANRGDTPRCKHCSAERSDDAKVAPRQEFAQPRPPPPPAPPPKKPAGKKAWLGLAVLLSCFGTCWWANATHDTTGQVTDTSWQRAVVQERFLPVQKSGWRDELRPTPPRMPVNGSGEEAGVTNIRDCVSRQRSTRQVADGRVACGTEEKCTRKDRGNGFVEEVCEDVTKYCSESYEDCRDETRYRTVPVFAQQCTYDTYEWKPQDRREASGRDDRPSWPELRVSGTDRLRREEKYAVRIQYGDGKEHVLEPRSEKEYLAWRKGQDVVLTVTNLGKVEKVVPR